MTGNGGGAYHRERRGGRGGVEWGSGGKCDGQSKRQGEEFEDEKMTTTTTTTDGDVEIGIGIRMRISAWSEKDKRGRGVQWYDIASYFPFHGFRLGGRIHGASHRLQ